MSDTPPIPEGVDAAAWKAIGARVNAAGEWETPERDADGIIIGWVRRCEGGGRKASKIATKGSKRGLTFVPPLHPYAGSSAREPIYIVEGASCAAAGVTIGLEVVGRPSVSGGVQHLRQLLKESHGCLIMERDGKTADEPGPGETEGRRVAEQLVESCASVRLILPPKGVKDLREWVIAGATAADVHAAVRQAAPLPRKGARDGLRQNAKTLGFAVDKHGNPTATQGNIRLAVELLGVRLEHDEFRLQDNIYGLEGFGPRLDDRGFNRLRLRIDEQFGLRAPKEFFADVVTDIAMERRRHPVREYLNALQWDGIPRVNRWLTEYLGVPESDYTCAVGGLILLAAVRRVRKPGCKFDEMAVLEGPQGDGKSSMLRILAVNEDWFTDDLPLNADTKKQMEVMQGRWIVEAGELQGMRKGEVEALKAFLSRQVDRARMAYGRFTTESPRQCVIVGTTNSDKYLKDPTGNRRFWPVRCGTLNPEGLRRHRDQLWAEAAAREAEGESIRLDPRLYQAAAAAQEHRVVNSVFYEILEPLLGERTGKVLADDLWRALGKGDKRDRRSEDMHLIGETMQRLGWERQKLRFGNGATQWGYARGTSEQRSERVYLGTTLEGDDAAVGGIPI